MRTNFGNPEAQINKILDYLDRLLAGLANSPFDHVKVPNFS